MGELVRTLDEATEPTAGAAPEGHLRPGEAVVLGRYRLQRRLGAGGFGVVWLARDERLQRDVAVKRIAMHDAATAARAEREARAAARLAHPGIVALYEAGSDEDAVYLVSELVRGATLAELMASGELSDREVLEIGVSLCDALAHAHGRGVIHRDVKPANVMVCAPAGDEAAPATAKLTDFGIARMAGDDVLTATGDVVGTLAYMAPEQAEGGEAGAEADLYALALVLYEALSGVNPVRGRGAAATARRLGARMPPLGRLRRDLPLGLCRAIDRAVGADPQQRGTIAELRGALLEATAGAGVERGTVAGVGGEGFVGHAAEAVAAPRPRPPLRPAARAVAALAVAGLAAAALRWLGSGPPMTPPAGAAVAAAAVLLLPRVGWLAVAAALGAWLGGDVAWLLAALALPTAVLLRRAGTLWSLPAAAPLLGAASLAGAWPVLAAQAGSAWRRAVLGALGFWWLALAEVLLGRRLALGAPPGTELHGAGGIDLGPIVTSGALGLAGLWAAAAVLLPIVVRGRRLAPDLIGACLWATGLASATRALSQTMAWQPEMRGLVAGAVVAVALSVAIAASRGDAYARSAP
ncbi:MAG: protein kinase domain-containing protein [Solirubrobacteraceae bacterium]